MANTLQAIAKDGIIPFLKPFEVKAANGEPIRALGITLCICQVEKTFFLRRSQKAGNSKGGSIIVPLTSCWTGLESTV